MSFIVNLHDNQFPNRTIRNIELRPAKDKTIMDSILSRPLGLWRVLNGAEVRIRSIELRKHIKPNDFNPCHALAMCSTTQCISHSVLCKPKPQHIVQFHKWNIKVVLLSIFNWRKQQGKILDWEQHQFLLQKHHNLLQITCQNLVWLNNQQKQFLS